MDVFDLRSGMPMPVYSSSIFFFLTHVKEKRKKNYIGIQPIEFKHDVNIRLSLCCGI